MGSITGDLCVSEGSTLKEVKYATIQLTDELRDLDGFIIECYYVDHRWVFSRKRDNCNNKDRLPIRVERFSRHLSIEGIIIDLKFFNLHDKKQMQFFFLFFYDREIGSFGEPCHPGDFAGSFGIVGRSFIFFA